jgi:fructose-1,6-bisphosphatase/sedoheptulose 1,7-bisphosphatase-like protein
VLFAGGAIVGPAAYQVAADLRADPTERTMVMAANRLILIAVLAIASGAVLAVTGVLDPATLLVGATAE